MEQSRTHKAVKGFCITFAIGCYVAAVAFGDVMFVMLMGEVFPDGFLRYLTIAGAVTTAVSACLLLWGKYSWFTPGKQMVWAYVFWIIEIGVLMLNTLLASHIALELTLTDVLLAWRDFSPATPFVCVIGWGLIFMWDESAKARNLASETSADLADLYAHEMKAAAKSQESIDALRAGARASAQSFVQSVTGQNVAVAWDKEQVVIKPTKVHQPEPVLHGTNGNNAGEHKSFTMPPNP